MLHMMRKTMTKNGFYTVRKLNFFGFNTVPFCYFCFIKKVVSTVVFVVLTWFWLVGFGFYIGFDGFYFGFE